MTSDRSTYCDSYLHADIHAYFWSYRSSYQCTDGRPIPSRPPLLLQHCEKQTNTNMACLLLVLLVVVVVLLLLLYYHYYYYYYYCDYYCSIAMTIQPKSAFARRRIKSGSSLARPQR